MRLGRDIVLAAALLPNLALAAEFDLGKLAVSGKIEVFNRTVEKSNAGAKNILYLNASDDYGIAWIEGVNFSSGTIDVEVRGKNAAGKSFVGIAFHGDDNRTFDAVYVRPFNFRAPESEHRSHSIQYVSLPKYDWSDLRKSFPGRYEFPLDPAPEPESWVNLKLVVEGMAVSAFVNGAPSPALRVRLLDRRTDGKLGVWVGNGSDGWFRNLTITSRDR